MSRSLPSAALLLVSPLLLVLSGCDTIYSNNYSYQKTKFMVVKDSAGNNQIKSSYVFQPYEQQALARAEVDRQRGEAERLSLAARNSEKVNADRMATDSPALKLDSGLGGLPPVGAGGMGGLGGTSSSIPGLDSMSSGASSMSSGSIPGLDSSMSGSSMSGSSMSGSSMSGAAPAPASTMSGGMMGASMEGGMSSGAAPAPASAPKPAAPAMLPGL